MKDFQILTLQIDGKEGAQFLRRSGLDNDVLGEIWKLAGNGKNKPTLSRNGWMIACLLVACAQQEGEPSIKAIASEDFELPDFALLLVYPQHSLNFHH